MLSSPRLLSRGAEEGRRLLLEPSSALPVPCPHGYRARRRAAARGPPVGRPRVGRPRAAAEQVARRARAPCEAVRGRARPYDGRSSRCCGAARRGSGGLPANQQSRSGAVDDHAASPTGVWAPLPGSRPPHRCRPAPRATWTSLACTIACLLRARVSALAHRLTDSREHLARLGETVAAKPTVVTETANRHSASPRPLTPFGACESACAPRRGGGPRVVEAAHGSG